MKNFSKKLAGLFLGAAMVLGVGAAVGVNSIHREAVEAKAAAGDNPITLSPDGGTNASVCTVNDNDGIKVGTSKLGGSLQIVVPGGAKNLYVYAAAWKDINNLSLNITGATISPSSISLTSDSGISNNSPFTLNGNESNYLFTIECNFANEQTLTFTTSIAKRFVLWSASYDVAGSKTLESISVGDAMTKTAYTTTEDWDPTGLTVTAHYSDSSAETVTEGVTWSFNPAAPALGVTSVKATASYSGQTADSDDQAVTVTTGSYTDTFGLDGKTMYLSHTRDDVEYFLKANDTSAPLATTSQGEASELSFTLVGNDTFTIKNNDDFMYCIDNNNGIRFGSTSDDNAKWLVSTGTLTTGAYDIKNVGRNRWVALYNNQDFRSYTPATATNRKENSDLTEAKEISSFAIVAGTGAQTSFVKGSSFDASVAKAAKYSAVVTYSDATQTDVTDFATWTLDTSVVTTNAVITAQYLDYSDTVSNIHIVSPVVTSLEIDASAAKTSYILNETFDNEGLVVTGKDSSGTVVIPSIELENLTFNPTVGTPLTVAGSQTITVSYTNDDSSTATNTYSVSVTSVDLYTKVDAVSDLEIGKEYLIGKADGSMIMSTTQNQNNRSAVEAICVDNQVSYTSEMQKVVLLPAEGGKYAFYDATLAKLLASVSSEANHLHTDGEYGKENAYASLSITEGLASITFSGDFTRNQLKYNSGSKIFSCYGSGQQDIALFESPNAVTNVGETWAQDFLDNCEIVCDPEGVTPLSESDWNDIADEFTLSKYNSAEMLMAKYAVASSGSKLESAFAQYDYIVGKYTTYDNFLGRSATSSPRINTLGDLNSETSVAIIVVISLVSVTAIGGYLFIRKTKHE